MNLLFASKNKHKLSEIKDLFNESGLAHIDLQSVVEDDRIDDIPEDFETIEENAAAKAEFIYNRYNTNVFADDTGLEIEALDGRPGVYSARYAGENCSFEDNVNKILDELNGITNRKAVFRTVICLIINNRSHYFEGRVEGEITLDKRGEKGFGYDPVFKPTGSDLTYAEMPLSEKNLTSHRAMAVKQMIAYLREQV
jgi:XTP/dITP diphosphohydrolase